MVDGTGLENRHTRKGIGGSNPSLSAIGYVIWQFHTGGTWTGIKSSERNLWAHVPLDRSQRRDGYL